MHFDSTLLVREMSRPVCSCNHIYHRRNPFLYLFNLLLCWRLHFPWEIVVVIVIVVFPPEAGDASPDMRGQRSVVKRWLGYSLNNMIESPNMDTSCCCWLCSKCLWIIWYDNDFTVLLVWIINYLKWSVMPSHGILTNVDFANVWGGRGGAAVQWDSPISQCLELGPVDVTKGIKLTIPKCIFLFHLFHNKHKLISSWHQFCHCFTFYPYNYIYGEDYDCSLIKIRIAFTFKYYFAPFVFHSSAGDIVCIWIIFLTCGTLGVSINIKIVICPI